jgi:hypothetical protein
VPADGADSGPGIMRGGALPAFRSVFGRIGVSNVVWPIVQSPRRLCADAGQTTTEWLMIAGALTAVGIVLLRWFPSTIHKFSEALVYSLRTIAL